MRMLLTVEMPHEPFNELVRNGTAGQIIGRILEESLFEVTLQPLQRPSNVADSDTIIMWTARLL